MRFPTRLVLAGSVLGALVASTGTALTLSDRTAGPAVEIPEFEPSAPPVPPAPVVTGPPVIGAQIVEMAVTPARGRAGALTAERAAAVRLERERAAEAPRPGRGAADLRRLREELGAQPVSSSR